MTREVNERGKRVSPLVCALPGDAFQKVLLTLALTDKVKQQGPVALDAGTYAAMCSFFSAGSGTGHAELGQYAVFTVTG
jgi:hypothetical protein